MAKKSMIQREEKRARLLAKYTKKHETIKFILPMYTRLLFWCSKKMSERELEILTWRTQPEELDAPLYSGDGDESSGGDEIMAPAQTPRFTERAIEKQERELQEDLIFAAQIDSEENSLGLGKRIELGKENEDHIYLPTDTLSHKSLAFSNDVWNGETFKYCIINSIYASVTVDGP